MKIGWLFNPRDLGLICCRKLWLTTNSRLVARKRRWITSLNGSPHGDEKCVAIEQGCYWPIDHRAKGLEFDHVAMLDGGWERIGRRLGRRSGPPPVLRGHDTRSSNIHLCSLHRTTPISGCFAGWPCGASSQRALDPRLKRLNSSVVFSG